MKNYKIFYKKDATKEDLPEAIYIATINTELELESVIIEADNIDDAFEIFKDNLTQNDEVEGEEEANED